MVRDNLRDIHGLPLSARLICDAHQILLHGARGAGKQPSELRRSQNWIGGSRPGNAVFVPPPPEQVPQLLADLERFIHAEPTLLPPLVTIALVHAQFETIHPFLDGNGIGYLLMRMANFEFHHRGRRPCLDGPFGRGSGGRNSKRARGCRTMRRSLGSRDAGVPGKDVLRKQHGIEARRSASHCRPFQMGRGREIRQPREGKAQGIQQGVRTISRRPVRFR
jgi:hypothetical protein